MNFQYVLNWNELLTYMIGWLVFLAIIKFLRLLRFNRRISSLAATLKNGARPLRSYLLLFLTTMFAYVCLFWGFFGKFYMKIVHYWIFWNIISESITKSVVSSFIFLNQMSIQLLSNTFCHFQEHLFEVIQLCYIRRRRFYQCPWVNLTMMLWP